MQKQTKINSIMMSDNDNYVSFNDEDVMTDYFHGYTLNIKSTIEWVLRHGAKIINVSFSNEYCSKFEKRLKNMCSKTDYEHEILKEEKTSYDGRKWVSISAIMTKKEAKKNGN